jgi:hypothetical protein
MRFVYKQPSRMQGWFLFFLIGRDGQQLSVGIKKIGWATRALRSLSSHDGAVTRLARAAQMA